MVLMSSDMILSICVMSAVTHILIYCMMSTTERRVLDTTRGQEDILCPDNKTLYENAATDGKAKQSSHWDEYGNASNAIDGNKESEYMKGFCSHTDAEIDPWWQVDLRKTHNVTFVTVTNRGDCCSDRISGAEIHVGESLVNNGNSNPLCAVIPYIPLGQTRTFPCGGMEGRYVNILLPGRNKYLTLCEVEVHTSTFQPVLESETSETVPNPYLDWLWELPWRSLLRPAIRREENVALMGRATQSSQLSSLTKAENAIDGRLDTEFLSGSCAHTRLQSDPWWRVDLLAVHRVTSVTVTNREDCCAWRLDGAEILIGNTLENNGNSNPKCAVISSIPAGDSVTFQCNRMEGRYVNIIRPGCYKFLSVCEVEVHAEPLHEGERLNQTNTEADVFSPEDTVETQCQVDTVPENLASTGSASQSSQYDNHTAADDAIDRKRTPLYHAGSCTHTKAETNPWWRVDLLDVYNITTVTITNRGDCCHERINGAEIHIGNDLDGANNPLCAVISEMREGQTMDFPCKEMEGRYVTVILPGKNKYLTLCEVEVYSSTNRDDPNQPSTPQRKLKRSRKDRVKPSTVVPLYTLCPSLENLAFSGSANQSSQYNYIGAASNAIDGKRTSTYFYNSCTHTKGETNPWWRVDLLDMYMITTVTITNRGDCCAERINGAEIRVGNDLDGTNNPLCAVISYMKLGQTRDFPCAEMKGRYVTVILPGNDKYLTLCEVEVYSSNQMEDPNPPSTPPPTRPSKPTVQYKNLASSGSASQSSQSNNLGAASNAIDGKREGLYYSSCTHTNGETNPWWRVDLLDVYNVTNVTITNRGDCCHEMINGAEIRVGNDLDGTNNPLCAVISEMTEGQTIDFPCKEMEGRYVTVILPGEKKYLTLCEVEVYSSTVKEDINPPSTTPPVPTENVLLKSLLWTFLQHL